MGSLAALSSSYFGQCYSLNLKDQVNCKKPREFSIRASAASLSMTSTNYRIGVLGASGYTGSEIIRLLANHPNFETTLLTADRKAGQPIGSVFPHLATQKEAVYGLTEICRSEIQNAQLVANPGCYPTSVQIPLVPLLKANLIEVGNIIIDSKSGVTGAGRGAKEANLYTEIAEGIHSYGVTRHRHVPEIEQGLSQAVGSKVIVSFTPHLMPMSRGMQSTIYVDMASGVSTEDLYQQLKNVYENETFVVLLKKNEIPHTRHVRGSNLCLLNVFPSRIPGQAIIISVIDNLVKGASGQALQNLNLMMGIPEETGLSALPLFP